jgi:hypothetical protein
MNHSMRNMRNLYLTHFMRNLRWLDQANGTMLYERRQNKQVLYVIPISSILGKRGVVVQCSPCAYVDLFDLFDLFDLLELVNSLFGGPGC